MKQIASNLILLLILSICQEGFSQAGAIGPESSFFSAIRANQNESTITFTQGFGNLDPLIFEAVIEPYFLIRTSRDAVWGATLSPAMKLRMYAEESLPVRTPSYMPHITFYHHLTHDNPDRLQLSYLFLTLAHHSNGQEDEFYTEDGSINYASGNFSTNYFEFGYFFNPQVLPFQNTNEYFKTSVEIHPGIDTNDELKGRYGFVRWHNRLKIYRFSWKRWLRHAEQKTISNSKIPMWNAVFETSWIFGNKDGAKVFEFSKRLNLMAKIAYKPPKIHDVSFFIKLYSGEDYYNIYFARRISYIQVGLQAFAF